MQIASQTNYSSDRSSAGQCYENLVLLASEQLWPNLETIFAYQQSLKNVLIVHTADERRSQTPALSLEEFCIQQKPNIQVQMLQVELDPATISKDVSDELARMNGLTLINITGGNKLMFAAFLELAHLQNTDFIYREIGTGDYLKLFRSDSGLRWIPFPLKPGTDKIHPVQLVTAHSRKRGDIQVEFSTPAKIDISAVTKALVKCDFDWRIAFARTTNIPLQDSGLLFEEYLAAGIESLNMGTVALNVKEKQGPIVVRENDVVMNYGQRLWLFDLKLVGRTGGSPISYQISDCNTRVRDLGGLGAKAMLVRPNLVFSEMERQLADAYGIALLDSKDTGRFFETIFKFISPTGKLPLALQTVDQLLAQSAYVAAGSGFRPLATKGTIHSNPPVNSGIELESLPEIQNIVSLDMWATTSRLLKQGSPAIVYVVTTSRILLRLGQKYTGFDNQLRITLRGQIQSLTVLAHDECFLMTVSNSSPALVSDIARKIADLLHSLQ